MFLYLGTLRSFCKTFLFSAEWILSPLSIRHQDRSVSNRSDRFDDCYALQCNQYNCIVLQSLVVKRQLATLNFSFRDIRKKKPGRQPQPVSALHANVTLKNRDSDKLQRVRTNCIFFVMMDVDQLNAMPCRAPSYVSGDTTINDHHHHRHG